jgi:hypothetical protein
MLCANLFFSAEICLTVYFAFAADATPPGTRSVPLHPEQRNQSDNRKAPRTTVSE